MAQEQEFELKFNIAPNMVARIAQHPALHILNPAPAVERNFKTTYFDTQDLALFQAKMVLRIRHDLTTGSIIQTFKMPDSETLLGRKEWEWPLTDETLDINVIRDAGVESSLPDSTLVTLVPVFTGNVVRKEILLSPKSGQVELSIDKGEFKLGEKIAPISELELELKQGPNTLVFDTAIHLCENGVPMRLSTLSKSERGYNLLKSLPETTHPTPTDSSPKALAAYALKNLIDILPEGSIIMDESALEAIKENLGELRAAITLVDSIPSDTRHAIAAMTQAPDLALLEPQATITFLEILRYIEG